MKNYISIPVWGEEYRSLLTDFCLPSLLGEGNLPKNKLGLKLFIYSPSDDWLAIKANPVFTDLGKHCAVEHIEIDNPGPDSSKHSHLNDTHGLIIQHAVKANAGVFMLLPDQIFSKGSFKRADEFIKEGKEVIMVPGLRVSYENDSAKNALLANRSQFSTVEAVDIFAKHMHFISAGCFWESENFTRLPSNIYHHLGGSEILGHIGHLHPFYLKYPVKACDHSTIDGAYIDQYNNYREVVQIVVDSSIIQLSLTSDSASYGWAKNQGVVCPLEEKKRIVLGFFKQWHGIHKWFGQQEIKFKGAKFTVKDIRSHFVWVDHSIDELRSVLNGEFTL